MSEYNDSQQSNSLLQDISPRYSAEDEEGYDDDEEGEGEEEEVLIDE